jgi:hypothetical protein
MGWFGFGGSRSRDERPRADARFKDNWADARSTDQFEDTRFGQDSRRLYEAVRIDRAGKPSRLLDERPRRRDFEDRRNRR